jgi:Fe-S cluster assembly protein SufD
VTTVSNAAELRLAPLALPEIGGKGEWAEARRSAARRFAETGLPGQRLERWKYTSLQPLTKLGFRLYGDAAVDEKALPDIPGTERIVFVNGRLDKRFGAVPTLAERSLAGPVRPEADMALEALNMALAEDGYVLEVTGRREKPLHVVHVATAGVAAHQRNIVRLAPGAEATIIETFIGEGADYWVNTVTDMALEKGAKLTHFKRQGESKDAFHTALASLTLAGDAHYEGLVVMTGSRLSRQEFVLSLMGEGASCRLRGVSLGGEGQHLDITVTVDHKSPNARSNQLFKSVLAKKARSVFQGLVKVGRGAVGTDADQKSENLLLDRSAEVDTKPELEIFADDVACSHGATVGELDEAKVFYLMQRGLPAGAARALLVEGFVAELFDDVTYAAIASYLREEAETAARHLTGGAA